MLKDGDDAPAFSLATTAGDETSLADSIDRGPAVLLMNRGTWCSYCAEQLETFSSLAYDLWRNHRVDVLPILGHPVPELVEMRDRFDLRMQLLSDPELSTVSAYGPTEDHPSFGEIPVAATYVVDTEGTIRYAQVAEHPADRTYANYVRALVSGDFERPYAD